MATLETARAGATAQWAALPNTVLKYVSSGTQGRVLLLLHEMGGTLDSWEPVLDLLPADRRIIRCDMRGAGGSEKIRSAATIDDFADDIIDLLDHLGLDTPVDVAGTAIGGCLSLRLAARYPSRIHRVAAINPPTDSNGRAGEVLRERARICDEQGTRGVVDSTLVRSWPDYIRTDTEAFEAYAARFICNDPTSYAHILRALEQVSFAGVLEVITRPTTFVSGKDDLVRRSADIEVIAKSVPGARFMIIDGGHIPSVQAPAAVAQALTEIFPAE